MSYFLWIEDFENNAKVTAENVFGSVLDQRLFDEKPFALKKKLLQEGIFIKLDLQEGLGFINRDLLNNIDFVILDIDLIAHDGEINDELLSLIKTYEDYQPSNDETEDDELRNIACTKLKPIAGFYLYTKLVFEMGFPKSHILFCSNHGESTESIQGAFHAARIALPTIYKKSDEYVKNWVKRNHENPYSRLRRGIIEGCRYILKLIEEKQLTTNELRFNDFIKKPEKEVGIEEIRDYVLVLEKFFPLREPRDFDKVTLYKLFIRALSHEWEAADPEKLRGLPWVMKNLRNWVSHNSLLFSCIDEKLLAYLFIINLRLMFGFDSKVQSYETILLALFSDALTEQLFKDKAKNDLLKPDIAKAYLDLKNKVLDEKGKDGVKINDGFYFNELANNIQQSNSPLKDDKHLFFELLYQMFWLITSNPLIDKKETGNFLEINFWRFKYQEKPYLFELARHIYEASFKRMDG